jgi:acyl carrier protein
MERQEILSKLNSILEDIIDNSRISLSESTTSGDVEGWDSLAHIQLIVALEKTYKIKFSSNEILGWKNVGEIIDAVLTKKSLN